MSHRAAVSCLLSVLVATMVAVVAGPVPALAQAPTAGGSTTVDSTAVELPPAPASIAPDNTPAVLSPAVTAGDTAGAAAPATPAGGPAAAPLFIAAGDSLTVLVDYRAEAEISRDLQTAIAEKALAERRLDRASMLATVAETHIEIKASEIKGLDAQIALAKAEKNEVKRAELESRRKYALTEKQLLERRRDLRRREIDTARAVRSYHDAAAKACRLEQDLAVRRRERASITSTVDPGAAAEFRKLQAEITKIEGNVLDAQVDQAARRKDLAEQEVQLGKVRRAVYESQLKVAR